MKFIKYLLFLLLILIIGLAIYIAVQPNAFEVTRSKTINAPVGVVYNNVIDFKNWEDWSPWVEKEPSTVITLADKTEGIGGSYSWVDKDGEGSIEIVEATPNASIKQTMQFGDFPASEINWEFEPLENNKTEVTWKISGKDLPFGFKAYSLFAGSMEEQIGPDFKRGLEKLDSVLVKSMKEFSVHVDGITDYGGGFYLYKTVAASNSNISETMGRQFGEIMSYMQSNNIPSSGMPFTVYESMDQTNGSVIMSQAIPVQNRVIITDENNILCGYIPMTKALKTTLKGDYSNLSRAWSVVMAHIEKHNLVQSDLKPFEIYITDPDDHPNPADWVTEIYIPITDQ